MTHHDNIPFLQLKTTGQISTSLPIVQRFLLLPTHLIVTSNFLFSEILSIHHCSFPVGIYELNRRHKQLLQFPINLLGPLNPPKPFLHCNYFFQSLRFSPVTNLRSVMKGVFPKQSEHSAQFFEQTVSPEPPPSVLGNVFKLSVGKEICELEKKKYEKQLKCCLVSNLGAGFQTRGLP